MITPASLRIAIRTGLVTAGLILLYELTNLLLVYHYLKYEYYIAGAVIVALITVMLTKKYDQQQTMASVNNNPLEGLTAKELRVLEFINAGKSNKEIASLNYTEMSTVKMHINNIFFNLGVKNRKEAVKVYQKSTLSPPVQI
jgi:DNA-binding CsgD family transcriptional regulator